MHVVRKTRDIVGHVPVLPSDPCVPFHCFDAELTLRRSPRLRHVCLDRIDFARNHAVRGKLGYLCHVQYLQARSEGMIVKESSTSQGVTETFPTRPIGQLIVHNREDVVISSLELEHVAIPPHFSDNMADL